MKLQRATSDGWGRPKLIGYELPPEILNRAVDGLSWSGVISAVTSVAFTVIQHLLQPEFAAAWRHPLLRLTSVCMLLLSVTFIAAQRSGRFSKRQLLNLGILFQVS